MPNPQQMEIYSRRGNREQALMALADFVQDDGNFDDEGDFRGGQRLKSLGEVLRVCGDLTEAVQVTTAAARLQTPWALNRQLCDELLELLAGEMPAETFKGASSEGTRLAGASALALAKNRLGVCTW